MKTIHSATTHILLLAITVAIGLQAVRCPGQTKENTTETEFPYVIPIELGTWAFVPGDNIKLTFLKGNQKHLVADGSYLIQGSYTLASADKATLLFSCTTSTSTGPTPIAEGQEIKVTRGSGTFSLKHPPCDGQYHVSFYVTGEHHSHGGIYFGEKDFEKTVLREADWSDISNSTPAEPGPAASVNENIGTTLATDPNRAIMAYLGHPVSAPPNLDAKYAPANLVAAFSSLSRRAGWRVQTLSVDNSEFPFLLYGLLAGSQHLSQKDIDAIKGYDYGGSVVGRGQDSTYFALNMIPYDQYPKDQVSACHRRLMIRLQMLADAAQKMK